ncbi:hypothetical protein ASPWEDRAFT_29749 [Aspergillus wentii DTO 134E9]|uniref:Uncharacterized protein n=1 Tax=Aspergillus wentii DTO 134E9 TaxID=1073089 RepID=A0A1L9RCE6_ASPWE|nr:uncharacterized protein ASPWEDRAFT_29749 [Aspergillus wentii DTO 134E9]KAI9924169.1 hypothetical protein MW887_007119 [Aspergillus wentii]OJJ32584.1 hypothetical protein ASPWEDRAFT_29749 [Aspergillus wentii DTO 134E9]
MTKHNSNHCRLAVAKPPTSLWTTNQTVAFPSSNKHNTDYTNCCGATAKITSYHTNCYKFCSVEANQTEVKTCLTDVGVKAVAFNKTTDTDTSSAPMRASPMSKSAIGLTLMVLASCAIGTL